MTLVITKFSASHLCQDGACSSRPDALSVRPFGALTLRITGFKVGMRDEG